MGAEAGRSRLWIVGLLPALVVAGLTPGLAAAEVGGHAAVGAAAVEDLDCDLPVVDTAGVLDVAAVNEVATSSDEVQFVVRAYDSVEGGDSAGALDRLIAGCFTDDAGDEQADLAVLAFSVGDRDAAVFLGRALPGGDLPDEARTTMTDQFGDGDFTSGVIAAMDLVIDAVDAGAAADVAEPAGAADPADPVGAGDTDGGGSDLPVTVGAVGAIAAAAGGYVALSRRRRLNDARRRFEGMVAQPRVRVGATRERGRRLEAQADLWSTTADGRTMEVLQELRSRARSALNDTDRAAALLSGATPRGIAHAGSGELERAEERLSELTAALDRNGLALDRLAALGARIDHLRVALPAKRDLLLGELAEAEALGRERREEGWRVDEPVARLAEVGAQIGRIDLNVFALDLLSLSDQIEAAEAALFAAEHDLQSLPDRPGSLAAWHDRLLEAAELEGRRVGQARVSLSALGVVHDAESWHWAVDHPEAAAGHVRRAEVLVDEAMAMAGPDQRFDDAGRSLERAGLELIAADDLLDQVEDLVVDLKRAKAEAPDLLAESRDVLAALTGYVAAHRGDLDEGLVRQPGEIGEALDGLDDELARPVPNHLRVAQTASQLNREVDQLLVAAKDQHAEAEALRRHAAREVSRANGALARARSSLGWQLLPTSDGQELDRLERRLASLPTEPEQQIAVAQQVAVAALVVQERIIARRRRRNTWVVVGGTHTGGGWGSGGGSGGGGGGSFGGGGGGGRSFGGGGGGGGSFGGGRSSGGW